MIIGSLQTTLGDLVESGEGFIQTGPFGSQLHAHDYAENGIPIVMPQQLGDNKISEYGIAQINEQDRDRLIRHVMRVGDIVFSRRGDVTRRAYITGKEDGWLCGTGCLLLRLNHPQCDNRYLVRFLGLHETRSYLTQHAIGATMPNLNQRILASVPVLLPPREHQEQIIRVISAYDDLIENNRRRIRLLEQAARLLYKEWFVHLRFPGHERLKIKDGVPEGWERKPLSALCTDIRESIHPKDMSPDVPYIGLEHIPRLSITLNSWGTAVEVDSSKFRFSEGDILFGKIRPYFHKVGFALLDGITSSDAIVIRPTENRLYFYVLSLLASNEFVALASKTVREGSKMPRADWNFLLKSEFKVPSKALLDFFNETMSPICRQLRTLALHNRKLGRSRDLLLPRLMNGEMTI